ncbi:MAG: hypothetical protein ACFUZC_16600 [Chthoniobacteraceae bacterium]
MNIVSELILKTSGFQSGVKNAEKSLQSMKSVGMGLKGVLMGAFAAITAGATAMKLKEQFAVGDDLDDLAAATGATVKSLVVMQAAFKEVGLDAEKVSPSIAKMRKSIADAAGGGANPFAQLSLSARELGTMEAADQMKAIGEAIMAIQNPTERTAAAMAVFGKQGQEMVKVFAAGALSDVADDVGKKAEIMDRNSALFGDISHKLEQISLKTEVAWAAIAEKVGPALVPILDKLMQLDFSKIGAQIGDLASEVITAFSSGEIANIVFGMLALAFEKACNILSGSLVAVVYAAGKLLIDIFMLAVEVLSAPVKADFWKGLGNALLGAAQEFVAYMLDGVAKILDGMRNIPGIGKKAGSAADATRGEAARIRGAAASNEQQGSNQLDTLGQGIKDKLEKLSDTSIAGNLKAGYDLAPKFDTDFMGKFIEDSYGKVLAIKGSQQAAADQFNKEHRPAKDGTAPEMGELGKPEKYGAVYASAMAKIGGGGISVGGGKDPLISESRRQTSLLAQIHATLKGKGGTLSGYNGRSAFA